MTTAPTNQTMLFIMVSLVPTAAISQVAYLNDGSAFSESLVAP